MDITLENCNCNVPYWEKTYIYSFPSSFPSKEISSFYEFFKYEFLNGNYIDLKENNNYAFCLMFDILENNKETIKEYLTIIAEKYPITEPYVKSELGKRGLYSKMYNGKEYFLYNIGNGYSTNIYCVKEDFWKKEQILYWLTKTDEFSLIGMMAFVNENGIIDVVTDESIKLYGNEKRCCKVLPIANRLPEYIKFGTVEGNFYYTNTGWNSKKHRESGYKGGLIEQHDIVTLEGCPEIVTGMFRCEKIGLVSLKGGPKKVQGDYIAKGNKLVTLDCIELEIGGDFNISNNELTDESFEYAQQNFIVNGRYIKKHNKFDKYAKNEMSCLEYEINQFLIKNKINFVFQKKFSWLGKQSLDFYLPDYNIAIECQGLQHFQAVDFFGGYEMFACNKERDDRKRKFCENNGITILYYSNLGLEYPYEVFENKKILFEKILSNKKNSGMVFDKG